jgi:hypothetical protein
MALVSSDVSEERIASIMRVTRIVFLRSVLWLLVTANVFLSSPILVALMMEAIRTSETSVLTRDPRGVTSQKTAFFIVTAVRTSNLT